MSTQVTLRPWTAADIPSLVSVALATYPLDPQWLWRYPDFHSHKDAAAAFISARFHAELEHNVPRGATTCLLAELPTSNDNPDDSKPETKVVVGFSIWINPNFHTAKPAPEQNYFPTTPPYIPAGASESRMRLFLRVLKADTDRIFTDVYGDRQLELGLLYVHPDAQGKGVAGAMLDWGFERAKRERVVVSLFASPMGRRVYAKRGFEVVGELKVREEGEGLVAYPGMVWVPEEYKEGGDTGKEVEMPRGKQVCDRR